MRAVLLPVALAAAVLVPAAIWYQPASAPAASTPAADERPERVLAAAHLPDPLGCPPPRLCDINRLKVMVVVGSDALLLTSNGGHAQLIARDGREWERLLGALRPLHLDPEYRDLAVTLDETAVYQDLLEALLFVHDAGFPPWVAQPRA